MKKSTISLDDIDLRIDLLRERIYATLALLAVLLTIDSAHTSPIKAAVIIVGTVTSLWLASLVASQMSYRIIMQKRQSKRHIDRQLLRHAPLLLAAALPLFSVSFAIFGAITLAAAINVAIVSSLLLIFAWSILSARAVRAGRIATLLLAVAELGIGLSIVGLKLLAGH